MTPPCNHSWEDPGHEIGILPRNVCLEKNPAGEYDTRLIIELELERANECDKAMHLRPATYRKSVPHEPSVVDHIPSSLSLAIASA